MDKTQIELPNILAVDGDIIAYRSAAVCEDHFEGACADIIDSTMKKIATDSGVNQMRVYLSGKTNFRYDVAKTMPYKGNRATMTKPQYLDFCKKYLADNYNGVYMHGFEADDGIASDMVQNGAAHCGIDKDILQVPGLHYNYVNEKWIKVSEEEAILRLYRQVLMGDTSDNIPGLPRIGEKKAEAAILNPETAREDAVEMYRQVCAEKLPDVDHMEYFVEQYKLVKMVTDLNFLNIFTVNVAPETEGFASHEGGFEGEPAKANITL